MPRAVVTGGAGLLGSHLCDRLLDEGWEVLCLDSLLTGSIDNLSDALRHPRFAFEEYDVTNDLHVHGNVDCILHFASPASPRDYLQHPIHTLKAGALGTLHGLGLAKAKGAAFFLASTSEVYGDPLMNPQPESYWGNVNPVGPRGVYDEAKRYAEAMTMAYHRAHRIRVHIARIFNTYGPRLRVDDGRAAPTFIGQALRGQPLTVHGDGTQTRSLCYVDDLVEGLWRLLMSEVAGPVNMGNPEEVTVNDLAELVRKLARSASEIVHVQRPEDDPSVRRPDIALAMSALRWQPEIALEDGLARTIAWAVEVGWGDPSGLGPEEPST